MSVPGFCGLRPAPVPDHPSTDPNADLIGHRFLVDTGEVGIVRGSAPWSSLYVEIDTESGPTVRVATQVRREKGLA